MIRIRLFTGYLMGLTLSAASAHATQCSPAPLLALEQSASLVPPPELVLQRPIG